MDGHRGGGARSSPPGPVLTAISTLWAASLRLGVWQSVRDNGLTEAETAWRWRESRSAAPAGSPPPQPGQKGGSGRGQTGASSSLW